MMAGYASDQTANTSPAFVAIPKLIYGILDTPHREAAPKVSLPEPLRAQIQKNIKKRGARRVGAGDETEFALLHYLGARLSL